MTATFLSALILLAAGAGAGFFLGYLVRDWIATRPRIVEIDLTGASRRPGTHSTLPDPDNWWLR